MRLVSAIYQGCYPFDHYFPNVEEISTVNPDDLREGDVLIVWGGGDISPTLYNKRVSRYTGASDKLSNRDCIEWDLMKRAKELGCAIIGICRGGQMLTALAGGYLIQHVNNHSGNHMVKTVDHQLIMVNSIHHQMMMPADSDHEVVAWSSEVLSNVHIDEDNDVPVDQEPEFIYYPGLKGFASQWHPEMMKADTEATKYVYNFMKDKL